MLGPAAAGALNAEPAAGRGCAYLTGGAIVADEIAERLLHDAIVTKHIAAAGTWLPLGSATAESGSGCEVVSEKFSLREVLTREFSEGTVVPLRPKRCVAPRRPSGLPGRCCPHGGGRGPMTFHRWQHGLLAF